MAKRLTTITVEDIEKELLKFKPLKRKAWSALEDQIITQGLAKQHSYKSIAKVIEQLTGNKRTHTSVASHAQRTVL